MREEWRKRFGERTGERAGMHVKESVLVSTAEKLDFFGSWLYVRRGT